MGSACSCHLQQLWSSWFAVSCPTTLQRTPSGDRSGGSPASPLALAVCVLWCHAQQRQHIHVSEQP